MTYNNSPEPDSNEPTVWEFLVGAIRNAPRSIVAWLQNPSTMASHEDASREEAGSTLPGLQQSVGPSADAGPKMSDRMPIDQREGFPGTTQAEPAVSYQVNTIPVESGAGIHVQFTATLPPGTRLHIDLSASPEAGEAPILVRSQSIEVGRQVSSSDASRPV